MAEHAQGGAALAGGSTRTAGVTEPQARPALESVSDTQEAHEPSLLAVADQPAQGATTTDDMVTADTSGQGTDQQASSPVPFCHVQLFKACSSEIWRVRPVLPILASLPHNRHIARGFVASCSR